MTVLNFEFKSGFLSYHRKFSPVCMIVDISCLVNIYDFVFAVTYNTSNTMLISRNTTILGCVPFGLEEK